MLLPLLLPLCYWTFCCHVHFVVVLGAAKVLARVVVLVDGDDGGGGNGAVILTLSLIVMYNVCLFCCKWHVHAYRCPRRSRSKLSLKNHVVLVHSLLAVPYVDRVSTLDTPIASRRDLPK